MKKKLYLSFFTLALSAISSATEQAPSFSIDNFKQEPTQSTLSLSYTLPDTIGILADELSFAIQNAEGCTVSAWKSSEKTTTCPITGQEAPAACFTDKGLITLVILHTAPEKLASAKLAITFKTNQSPTSKITFIDLPKNTPAGQEDKSFWQKTSQYFDETLNWLKTSISSLVERTKSRPIQILFILLLGLLMSLTPCIYPMIPITIGIIQSNKAQTLGRNFVLACAYAVGIATTFALMGLLVALGGAQFGSLLGKPLFILFIVAFLGYFAGSMFGFYEVKLPQFAAANIQSKGSLSSAFIFGAISGTVTSPCLSPGLVLVLGIVAKLKVAAAGTLSLLQSGLIGFSYLFAFGIGLSIPLIIIATFSGAADKLPRSGLWMIEVKKIFGFLLVALCFGYIQPLVSPALFSIIAGLALIIIGFLLWRMPRYGGGILLKGYIFLINSLVIAIGLYFTSMGLYYYTAAPKTVELPQIKTISEAFVYAKENKKPYILIEFGAAWCSLCNKIKTKIMHNDEYRNALATQGIILAHCDCTQSDNLTVQAYKKEYGVTQGLPVVLLVDSATNTILKQWRSEILKHSAQELVQEIQQIIA
ncbi:MAG: Thiol:disulfide interchange protein [candidate division TM6 bacterium GW2011_GWF2_43_17]|nr:MAG: Thiol:disulfide interchange protein [candidate division TM6 bacterium GW2011_GWF2_43_17]HAU30481.1 hypothetical protein [Candidatus Dependentiae bacterium]